MNKTDIIRLAKSKDDSLRPYQQENKSEIFQSFIEYKSAMLQMPTGTGKTRLFVSIIKEFDALGKAKGKPFKILVIAHRIELIDQISHELGTKYGIEHGIIHRTKDERMDLPIQVASVQTLNRRLERWKKFGFDLIIVDEAHHVTAVSYRNVIKAFPKAKLLGVTATPYRLSGEGFVDIFEDLILSEPIGQFIADGYLSHYDYYSIGKYSFVQNEINGIKKFSQGDYAESELDRVCNTEKIRAQVVETYTLYAKGKKGIVYTINKSHNEQLKENFNAAGYKCVAIDSDTPAEDRAKYIEQFKKGKIKVICNVNIFSEGFDCPDIEFIQLARPTKSMSMYLQQVGRGLRVTKKKSKAVILDNVGLYNEFGLPSEDRDWGKHFIGKGKVDKATRTRIRNKSKVAHDKKKISEGHEEVHLIQTTLDKEYDALRQHKFELAGKGEYHIPTFKRLYHFRKGYLNDLQEIIVRHQRILDKKKHFPNEIEFVGLTSEALLNIYTAVTCSVKNGKRLLLAHPDHVITKDFNGVNTKELEESIFRSRFQLVENIRKLKAAEERLAQEEERRKKAKKKKKNKNIILIAPPNNQKQYSLIDTYKEAHYYVDCFVSPECMSKEQQNAFRDSSGEYLAMQVYNLYLFAYTLSTSPKIEEANLGIEIWNQLSGIPVPLRQPKIPEELTEFEKHIKGRRGVKLVQKDIVRSEQDIESAAIVARLTSLNAKEKNGVSLLIDVIMQMFENNKLQSNEIKIDNILKNQFAQMVPEYISDADLATYIFKMPEVGLGEIPMQRMYGSTNDYAKMTERGYKLVLTPSFLKLLRSAKGRESLKNALQGKQH